MTCIIRSRKIRTFASIAEGGEHRRRLRGLGHEAGDCCIATGRRAPAVAIADPSQASAVPAPLDVGMMSPHHFRWDG